MIRILQVVNDMHRAGLETMLMNYYRNIDRTKIQFDFLTHRPNKSDYDDEIIAMGGRVYYAPRLYPQNYPTYFKWMRQFFYEHPEYKIIHSHIDSMSYLPLLAAKKVGIPIRIAHSHNTSIDKDFKYILKQIFRFNITTVSNLYCACGQNAGKFLFKNHKFTVIPNAIEASHFLFSQNIRNRKREELNLKNKFVVGHVGRLSYQKNHKFLIQIFKEVHKMQNNAILVLVGVGEKEKKIRKQVNELGLQNSVMFLGNRSDVNELYQAMDIFVMPSLFEGIPVVGIEAQFSGLQCVFSDKVPKEVDIFNESNFISLKLDEKEWAIKILELGKHINRANHIDIKSEYNIINAKDLLIQYYEEAYSKIKFAGDKSE